MSERSESNGGEGGIRTLESLATLPVFETGALDQLCDLSTLELYPILTFFQLSRLIN